jgi:hypothetical protein
VIDRVGERFVAQEAVHQDPSLCDCQSGAVIPQSPIL